MRFYQTWIRRFSGHKPRKRSTPNARVAYARVQYSNRTRESGTAKCEHHLTTDDKQRALQQVHRTLKSGGALLIVDFAKPGNWFAWVISRIMRRMEKAADLIRGELMTMIQQAGFQDMQIVEQCMTVFGTLAFYRGIKSQVE